MQRLADKESADVLIHVHERVASPKDGVLSSVFTADVADSALGGSKTECKASYFVPRHISYGYERPTVGVHTTRMNPAT